MQEKDKGAPAIESGTWVGGGRNSAAYKNFIKFIFKELMQLR